MRARLRTMVAGMAVALVCGCAMPVAAQAAFEVRPGGFAVSTSSDQAGAHADLTTSFAFAQNESGGVGALLRNVDVVLPVGFAAYPAAMRTCSSVQLQLEDCPTSSQVGIIEITFRIYPEVFSTFTTPVFNMAPPPNETAVFGVSVGGIVSFDIVLSVGPDYRGRAKVENAVAAAEVVRQSLTVWGVPADPSHDAQRGSKYRCEQYTFGGVTGTNSCQRGGAEANENPVPFLVNPTQCTPEPLTAELEGVESWEGEKAPTATATVGPFTGCESLKFAPTISVQPEQKQATTPTGYAVDLNVPQTEGAEGFATADLKDAVVKLPAGVVLSPSAANGLEACAEALVGLGEESPVECPQASKIGAVSLVTPALSGELKGALYLGGPPSGPITKPPFTVYLTLAGHGVLVKIKGTATPDPVTGQVTTVFDENPELPFSELKLQLTGGSRATLANPSVCGSYAAEGDLTPWTSPLEPDVLTSSLPFQITGCQGPRFNPSFAASTLSNQAGGYSTMRVTFSREDADQNLAGLTVTMPPGVSGNLSKVPLCGEPQAAEGTCPEASRIGEVTAGAGPGPEPYFIKGGRVFITGPYHGAPFGLSIDVPEKAGPFDLGTGPCDCEVVRATVNIDPHTAQLTVSNGALPTIKDGIPFQVKTVNVDINRPEFVFNPTSCNPMSVNGTLSSTQGMSAQVSSHFQATNCAALAFKPSFKASTSGKTSRADGASLTVKLTYPNAPQGTQANLRSVKVDLPKQLVSRLTTLQKACLDSVFGQNPAACPAASIVGTAKATTPLLPVPLTGPVYFVSHGGAKFPELVIVLSGYGVTVQLYSETFISKAGITSSTFRTIPDVPVGTFELTLPEGPYSALDPNGNLCQAGRTVLVRKRVKVRSGGHVHTVTRLVRKRTGGIVMPTAFTAQNGAVIHQNTPVAVTGCPKGKARKARRVGRHR